MLSAAIVSFIAASDVKKRPSHAVVLSLIAGIVGIVITFWTTLERYANYKTNADVDKEKLEKALKVPGWWSYFTSSSADNNAADNAV